MKQADVVGFDAVQPGTSDWPADPIVDRVRARDARPRAARDLRPTRAVLGGVLRYGVLILSLVALAVAAMASQERSDETRTATARLALTNRIGWPFYDAARDRQRQLLLEPSTLAAVQQKLADAGQLIAGDGGQPIALSIDSPPNQAFLDITSRAGSAIVAQQAADAAATYLVEQSRSRAEEQARATRDNAAAQVKLIDTTVADLTRQLEDLDRRQAELQPETYGNTPSRDVLTEFKLNGERLDALSQERAAERSRRTKFVDQVDTSNLQLASVIPEVEVLRTAAVNAAVKKSLLKGRMILAGGAAGVLGVLVVTGFDARWARLRNRRHAASSAARDIPVVEPSRKLAEPHASADYAARVIGLRQVGEVLGIVSLEPQTGEILVEATAAMMVEQGRSIVTVGKPSTFLTAHDRVPMHSLESYPREPGWSAVHATRSLVNQARHVHIELGLPDSGVDSALVLHRVLHSLTESADLVMLDCGQIGDDNALWTTTARACDGLIIVAEPKLSRQSRLRNAVRQARLRDLPVIGVALGRPNP